MEKNRKKGGDCAKVSSKAARQDKKKPYGNIIIEKKGGIL